MQYRSCMLLVLLGLIWGSGYSIARYCVTHGVAPLGYSFWQSLGPALVLCILLFSKGEFLRRSWLSFRYYAFCGLIGISVPNSIMYFGASHLSSAVLAILVNTVPLMIFPLSLISRQEIFSWPRISILLFGLFGIFTVILNQQGIPELSNIPWTFIVLLTPICFAVCAVFINPLKPVNLSSLNSSAGMLLASAIFLTPLMLKEGSFYSLSLNLPSALILVEIALSSLGYWLFFKLLEKAGPVYYSLVSGVITVTGLFWGRVLFQEELGAWDYLGAICIVISIVALSYYFPQKKTKKKRSGIIYVAKTLIFVDAKQ